MSGRVTARHGSSVLGVVHFLDDVVRSAARDVRLVTVEHCLLDSQPLPSAPSFLPCLSAPRRPSLITLPCCHPSHITFPLHFFPTSFQVSSTVSSLPSPNISSTMLSFRVSARRYHGRHLVVSRPFVNFGCGIGMGPMLASWCSDCSFLVIPVARLDRVWRPEMDKYRHW